MFYQQNIRANTTTLKEKQTQQATLKENHK